MNGPDYADVGWYWNWNDAPDKKNLGVNLPHWLQELRGNYPS